MRDTAPEAHDLISVDEDIRPWERQPNEPDRSWVMFREYRDLGVKRTIKAAYAKVYGDLPTTETQGWMWALARNNNWKKRAAAYDNYEDRRLKEVEIEGLVEMRARHIKTAKALLNLGMMELQAAIDEVADRRKKGKKGRTLEIKDIKAVIELAAKLESVSRGQASEIKATQDAGQFQNYAELVAAVEDAHRNDSGVDHAIVVDIKELPESTSG